MIYAMVQFKGATFEYDNNLYKVLEYHHHKPGR